jgi:uncharacterized protein YdhG (YjbR/CyaY superfamily)
MLSATAGADAPDVEDVVAGTARKNQQAAPGGDVDRYLASLPDHQRTALQKVRAAIRAAAPRAVEGLSYGMPAFKVDGKLIAGFRAAKDHNSYHPMSGTVVAALATALAGYDTAKGTVRFPADEALPATLVRRLVRTRIAEIAGA